MCGSGVCVCLYVFAPVCVYNVARAFSHPHAAKYEIGIIVYSHRVRTAKKLCEFYFHGQSSRAALAAAACATAAGTAAASTSSHNSRILLAAALAEFTINLQVPLITMHLLHPASTDGVQVFFVCVCAEEDLSFRFVCV